jgi:hypothetical protein
MQRVAFRVRLAVLGLLACASVATAQTPITHCGASWSEDVVLTGDLDCSGDQNPAVTLADDVTLDLAGFTLTGGASTAVSCVRDCRIVGGGGTITGAALDGVVAPAGDVVASDVSISGNGGSGISAWQKGSVTATNVTTDDNGWGTGGGGGIEARFLTATGCAAAGNHRSGFFGAKLVTVIGSSSNGNRRGVYGHRKIVLVDSLVTNNSHGVYGRKRVAIEGSIVTGNVNGGVWSDRVIEIATSTIVDNGEAPACLEWICADIVSMVPPRVSSVSCEKSGHYTNRDGYVGSWGICVDD